MRGTSQSLMTTIVAFVMIMIAVLYGLAVFTENHQQLTSNQAVQSALADAQDSSGRVTRGTFVLNTKRFEQDLLDSNIDNWRKIDNRLNHKQGSARADKPALKYKNSSKTTLAFYYLPDDSQEAKEFNTLNAQNKKPLEAIKAVKVIVTQNVGMSPSEAKKKLADDKYGVFGVNNIKNMDITKQIRDGSINDSNCQAKTGSNQVYLTRPIDVVTYVVNSVINIRPDDIYSYSPTEDYKNQEYANKHDEAKHKRTEQYLDTHDVDNYDQTNQYTAPDKQIRKWRNKVTPHGAPINPMRHMVHLNTRSSINF